MSSYALGLYEKAMPGSLTWEEKFQAAGMAGYDFIEISIDETDEKLERLNWSREDRLKLVESMYRCRMPLGSMCLSGHRRYPLGSSDPKTEERAMEIMEKAVGLASDLGIRVIQLAGYDVYYEESDQETKARFERNLKKAAMLAAKAGVVMGFETMETEFMNTVKKSMHYVNLICSPFLGVYPDTGNIKNAAVAYKTDVLADLDAGKGHLAAVHLKETVPGKFREIPYGTGHVDFEAMISKAWELGVRRYVTEFWYTGSEKWEDSLSFASHMMKEILDRQCRDHGD